jgi:hypothetical protein
VRAYPLSRFRLVLHLRAFLKLHRVAGWALTSMFPPASGAENPLACIIKYFLP